ncbi:MAG TPA: hypothetical protein VKO20_07775, partial [Desulfosalsimonadaceae bacterium]|nr:hypothetical protein [Desulfosalsimonadaceae bacterium]
LCSLITRLLWYLQAIVNRKDAMENRAIIEFGLQHRYFPRRHVRPTTPRGFQGVVDKLLRQFFAGIRLLKQFFSGMQEFLDYRSNSLVKGNYTGCAAVFLLCAKMSTCPKHLWIVFVLSPYLRN